MLILVFLNAPWLREMLTPGEVRWGGVLECHQDCRGQWTWVIMLFGAGEVQGVVLGEGWRTGALGVMRWQSGETKFGRFVSSGY